MSCFHAVVLASLHSVSISPETIESDAWGQVAQFWEQHRMDRAGS
jgi:hypothetical protein